MARRSFRDVLRKGRRNLHEHMEVPALYIAYPTAVPVELTVRDHTRVVSTGDKGSFGKGYAEMSELEPRIIFLREDLEDARNGAIFSISEGEAWRVERTDPPNDITRTALVTALSTTEAAGLPVPEVV